MLRSEFVEELGANVAVIGLARKRLEEIWIPGMDFPVILSRTSRRCGCSSIFAMSPTALPSRSTVKRAAAMTRSALDDIAGLGPAKQAALLKHFKSVARIKAASIVDLQAVAGIGPTLATTIYSLCRKLG